MNTFGIIISAIVIAVLIFYIGFNVGANFEFAQNCDYEEKYENEKKKRQYYQKIAENPPQILSVKMIGEAYVKDFVVKK